MTDSVSSTGREVVKMSAMTYEPQVAPFYNAFVSKLLADYWNGNPRFIAAFRHAIRWIPERPVRVLDIGCGIGWSTREMARLRPKAEVIGLDISQDLLNTARILSDNGGPRFVLHDFCTLETSDLGSFDVIVMLDVYEHFAAESRPRVHATFDRLINPKGAIVLAYPTPEHQNFLRLRHPDAIQPIDEDVTDSDIARLAGDVSGIVAYSKIVTIWRKNDYAHAVVVRADKDSPVDRPRLTGGEQLEPKSVRQARVRSKLRVRVLEGEMTVPFEDGPALCIATPNLNAYSETFVKAHITHLPMPVRVLSGTPIMFDDERQCLVRSSLPQRFANRFRKVVLRETPERILTEATMRWFRRNRIAVVLAEYGTTGVDLLEACVRTATPLVVHFHGFDAFRESVLEKHKSQYSRMFKTAAAIIAVSQDMMRQLASLGAPTNKTIYIPCGVDPTIFDEAMPGESPPHFLAVGRFVEKKAPQLTLLAFARVLEACPDATLTMIGDGCLLGPCRHLAEALSISRAVEFSGSRNQRFVSSAMRESRSFVQHSIRAFDGDSEGTPVAILEAQVSGLPVVSTTHAGIKDVVMSGETGLLVAEGNVNGMADAMIELAKSPSRAAELGKAARHRALKEYTLTQSIQKLATAIRSASGNRIPVRKRITSSAHLVSGDPQLTA